MAAGGELALASSAGVAEGEVGNSVPTVAVTSPLGAASTVAARVGTANELTEEGACAAVGIVATAVPSSSTDAPAA